MNDTKKTAAGNLAAAACSAGWQATAREMTPMAARHESACNSFVACVAEQFGFTIDQAQTILAVYLRHKAVKIDRHIGQFMLSHGDLWTRDAMIRALAHA